MADEELDIGALYDRISIQDTKLAGVMSDVANIKGTVESTNAAVLGLQQAISADRGTDWPVFISGLALIVVVLGGIFGFAYSILGTQHAKDNLRTEFRIAEEKNERLQIEKTLVDLIISVKDETTSESVARRDRLEDQVEGRETALRMWLNERQEAYIHSSQGLRDRLSRLENQVFKVP